MFRLIGYIFYRNIFFFFNKPKRIVACDFQISTEANFSTFFISHAAEKRG